MPLQRIIIMWLLFLPVPVINGLLREMWYKPIVGELLAGQIGTVAVSAVFLLYVYLFFKNALSALSSRQLLLMGGIWLILTLIFEFGIGIAAGRSWSYMLSDYNVLKGRIWPLLLAIVFTSPFIVRMIVTKENQ